MYPIPSDELMTSSGMRMPPRGRARLNAFARSVQLPAGDVVERLLAFALSIDQVEDPDLRQYLGDLLERALAFPPDADTGLPVDPVAYWRRRR